METKVFIVHMPPSLGSRFFTKAKEVGMMSAGYVWIITDSITIFLSSLDPWVIDSMQGVLGVEPHVPRARALQKFVVRFKRKFQQEYPTVLETEVNVFGLWAYDAAIALAMAVEEIRAKGLGGFRKTNVSENLTDLVTLEVSDMGKSLLEALLNTSFSGLSGNFHIVDGQIQSPACQIVTGFSIDVFDTVIKALPYEVSYTYIPFVGTYDDLIYQVFLGKFDAVVGDTTITANRSLYLDFTLPYTATGISMIVPLKEEKGKD